MVDSLEYYLDALAFPFEMNEIADITISDIIEAITEQIYQRCSVIGYYHAWQLIWSYGFSETQDIADEYGIDQPLFHIEQVATACLQRALSEQLWEMRDEMEKIWNETPIDEE